jgi:hypothetical protein
MTDPIPSPYRTKMGGNGSGQPVRRAATRAAVGRLPKPDAPSGAATSRGPRSRANAAPARRGRPPGVRLPTGVRLAQLLHLIRGGAIPVTAAVAIGIPRRTFLEWVARGRGIHPTRVSTRQLREFVEAIDKAEAEVKAEAQIRLRRENLPKWLGLRRSSDQEELALEPPPGSPAAWGGRPESPKPPPIHEFTQEDQVAVIAILIEAGVVPVPACPDPACTCRFHDDPAGMFVRIEAAKAQKRVELSEASRQGRTT